MIGIDRADLELVAKATVLFVLGLVLLVGAGLAAGIAWRTFSWAAGVGG